MSLTVKERFTKIESMLKSIIGTQKTEDMTIDQFTVYAQGEITKAISEGPVESKKRLSALAHAIAVAKDNFTDDESESIKVPVYVCDSTALEEKSNELMSPLQVGSDPSGQSYFEKFAALKNSIEGFAKQFEDDAEEEEKRKKAAEAAPPAAAAPPAPPSSGDLEEDEEEKRKKAAAKAAGDIEEGDDSLKAKAKDKDEAEKTKKGIDKSPDGTAWPSDMNDPDFQKNGTVEKSLEWGKDA